MDTYSCESDAAEELLPPYPGKHQTTDRDVGPLKRHKYDENYIDLGFTYIGRSLSSATVCYMCKSTIPQLNETFTLVQIFRNKTWQF
jgi:hypothetical protein